jgi:hypothetical protein
MVANSPRARAIVKITTAIPAATSVNSRGPLALSVSPSTTTPSSDATTGLATVTVGSDAVNAPARNADCWKIIPASAADIRRRAQKRREASGHRPDHIPHRGRQCGTQRNQRRKVRL